MCNCQCPKWRPGWRCVLLVFLFTALLVAASWAIQMGYVEWFLNYIKQFGYFGSMAIVAGLMVVGTSPIGGVLYSAIQIGAGYAFGWPAWPAVYVGALVGDLIAYQFCSLWLLQGKTPEQLASAMPGKTAQRWARAITLGINDEDYRFFFAAAARLSPVFVSFQNIILAGSNVPFASVFVPSTMLALCVDTTMGIWEGRLVNNVAKYVSTSDNATAQNATVKADIAHHNEMLIQITIQVVAVLTLIVLMTLAVKKVFKAKLDEVDAITDTYVPATDDGGESQACIEEALTVSRARRLSSSTSPAAAAILARRRSVSGCNQDPTERLLKRERTHSHPEPSLSPREAAAAGFQNYNSAAGAEPRAGFGDTPRPTVADKPCSAPGPLTDDHQQQAAPRP